MTKFVGGYDPRGPVGQARRGDRKPGEQGQPVEGNSPQQGTEHDRHEHRMKVDDDIMCPSFLKRFGVGRLPEHHFEQRIHAQEHQERSGHPPSAKSQADQREQRRHQSPKMGNPRPTLAHQERLHACDL